MVNRYFALTNIAFVVFCLVFAVGSNAAAADKSAEYALWEQQATNVKIVRDDWGIAHVTGKTDADAVFGAIYAQAEDDFNRVETNYLTALGRTAEAEGEKAIWSDLRQKMFIDPAVLKADFAASPVWLRKLMTAWAFGLNFYLAKHPETKPRVITHFEPWMALSFTEGSIGGDIETINLGQLAAFYGNVGVAAKKDDDDELFKEPSGSNGIAIAPENTKNKHALLLINPHTSFFFRSELQMTSGEGLNTYGASTWGQFFIYQGFNENCGWMHTSSAVDAIDEFLETVTKKGDLYTYKHAGEQLPVTATPVKVPYKTDKGIEVREFTVYRTPHGPVVRKTEDGKWVTISLMNKPIDALTQSYIRTKSKNYQEFKKAFDLHSDSSNNTIYADRDGNIAYFHANYILRRDPKFDWTKPVDGTDPATDYKGLLTVDESPNLFNPKSGWLYNSNNWPWSAAGASSLKQSDFPKWVDSGYESARGLHAIKVLENKKDFTIESLNAAAYDSYLTWFDKRLAVLIKAWDTAPSGDSLKSKTAAQIAVLRAWDQRWSIDSVATSVAVYWGQEMVRKFPRESNRPSNISLASVDDKYLAGVRQDMLFALVNASDKLTADFGTWQTKWGEINRFQRLNDDIVHPFTDAGPSIPVGFTSALWGSLASFGARSYKGSKKIYGTSGNSFVAVVEFGPKVRAHAVTAGGESGNITSKHFNDQAVRYSTGNLREVYFYPVQLKDHTEREYHPGN